MCAIKSLAGEIKKEAERYGDDDPILAFIDMHGHSRKKNVFIYGPYYPLHDGRFLQMRVLPQLLADKTQMFRYFSCKFRIEKEKRRAARLVLWREFGIMNCFTLEASFHGYLNKERETVVFTTEAWEKMGGQFCSTLYEYLLILDNFERKRELRRKMRTRVRDSTPFGLERDRNQGDPLSSA